jgi:tRNA G18 (ribose-2'-O)-methylase SpoU
VVCGVDATRTSARVIRVDSLDDPRVAEYRWVGDHEALVGAGLFVAEGRLVVRRLLAEPRFTVHSVLVTKPAFAALRDVFAARTPQTPVYIVEQETMNGVTGFNMHRGCLALAERPAVASLDTSAAPLENLARVVILEGVNNPDNVGGIFRSAAALGADAVIVGPDSSDPLYRKAIRTSMAATLQIPFFAAGAWPDAITTIRNAGFDVIALAPAASARPLDDLPRNLPRVALLVGAEGSGLTADALSAADTCVRIPMQGSTDSLNVAVATSIALYHFSG